MRSKLFRNTARRGREGMTLVEIMVVIAILGSLMAIFTVGMVGYIDDGNVETTKLQMKQIEQGLQLFAAKNKGKFPTTSEGLEGAKKYFPDSKVPTDSWGNAFQYFSPGSHSDKAYELVSLGKDGVEGGDGADADINSWELGD